MEKLQPVNSPGKYAFLSYAHKNRSQVEALIKAFQQEGYRVWFDINLELGELYNNTIAEKIIGCEVFVCFISKEFGESYYCQKELRLAVEKCHKPIVPVFLGNQQKIEESLPPEVLLLTAGTHSFSINGLNNRERFIEIVNQASALDACKGDAIPIGHEPKKQPIISTLLWIGIGIIVLVVGVIVFVKLKDIMVHYHPQSSSTSPSETATPLPTATPFATTDPLIEILERLRMAKENDIVEFGTYEQDCNDNNGKELINWIVLEKRGDMLLLLSQQTLNAIPYNDERIDMTWEKSQLRAWLNDEFYDAAFNTNEKQLISETTVESHNNSFVEYAEQGNATRDNVFLLSIQEVDKYLSEKDRTCEPTQYAIEQGAWINENIGKGWWWLRTIGRFPYSAAIITYDDFVHSDGFFVDFDDVGVRPALWIDLGKVN